MFALDERDYRDLSDHAELSEAQQQFLDEHFAKYRESLSEQSDQLKQVLRPLGLVIVGLSPQERRSNPAVMIEAAVAVRREFGKAKSRMVEALQRFESDCLEVLSETQTFRWCAQMRAWRRGLLLDSWSDGSDAPRDLGRHVDLINLARELSEADPLIAHWLGEVTAADFCGPDGRDGESGLETRGTGEGEDVRTRLQETFQSYILELDGLFTMHFWAGFTDSMEARIDVMTGDVEAVERARAAGIRRWNAVYGLNQRTADIVAALLHEAGASQCAEQWLAALEQRYFPQLFADTSVDLAYRWLMGADDLSDEVHDSIKQLYEAFRARRDLIRRQIKQRLLRLVLVDGVLPRQVGFLRRIGQLPEIDDLAQRRHELTEQTLGSFCAMLPDVKREVWERLVQRFREQGIDGEALDF